jgi:hypothetical protein
MPVPDSTAALARLALIIQADASPELDDDELIGILGLPRTTVWDPNTAYVFGQQITPVARNGARFRCIVGGTSGATEPSFPAPEQFSSDRDPHTVAPHSSSSALSGQRVTDGTVEWLYEGPDYDEPYDVEEAVRRGRRVKASKAVEMIDVEEPIYKHARDMLEFDAGGQLLIG